jgi:hypothetical protein
MPKRLLILVAAAFALAMPAFAEKLTVKTLTGKSIELQVKLTDSVESLKKQVADKEGIPVEQQRIIYAGKTLNDYGITNDVTVQLVLRLRGG